MNAPVDTASDPATLEAILGLVHARTGLDFTGYRRPTMQRRVRNRMLSVGSATFAAYLGLLRSCAPETDALVDRLMIKVSRFYRNAPAFDLLRHTVIPALGERRDRPLRVWSAGCGRGEEAHTLAMLLEEAGVEGEVLATDVDPGALTDARLACYGEAALGELPEALRRRFLETAGPGHWRVAAAVRGRIQWRSDNLASPEAAIRASFDLVCCRNVLIYLDRPTQERVFARVVSSIVPGGYLLLGEAEWPCAAVLPLLANIAHRARLFRAQPAPTSP